MHTVTKRGVGGSSFVAGYRRILTPDDSLEAHTMLGVHSLHIRNMASSAADLWAAICTRQAVVNLAMRSSVCRPEDAAAAAKHAAAGGARLRDAGDHVAAGPGLRAAAGHRAAAVDTLARRGQLDRGAPRRERPGRRPHPPRREQRPHLQAGREQPAGSRLFWVLSEAPQRGRIHCLVIGMPCGCLLALSTATTAVPLACARIDTALRASAAINAAWSRCCSRLPTKSS